MRPVGVAGALGVGWAFVVALSLGVPMEVGGKMAEFE